MRGAVVSLFVVLVSACAEPEAVPQGPTAEFTWVESCDRVPAAEFVSGSMPGDAPITDYAWDFGDGQVSDEQHPEHRFEGPGPYSVSLTVTDQDGREHTHSEEVDVRTCLYVVDIGTQLEVTQITAYADILNASGHGDALVSFEFSILDLAGDPWLTGIDGGQVEIPDGATIRVGGIDWRDCGADCAMAGEVELQLISSYWVDP